MVIRGYGREWHEGVDAPCIMRGARFVMVAARGNGSWFSVELVMRYVRMKRLTFLDVDDWQHFLCGTKKKPGIGVLAERRDCARYGRKVFSLLAGMVDANKYRLHGSVIVDGRPMDIFDPDQYRALRKLNTAISKIEEISRRIGDD